MPEGTVRGRVELATPARASLRTLREDAVATDTAFQHLGTTLDDTFSGRAMASKDAYRENVRGLRDDVKDVTSSVKDLREELRLLGVQRATPTIDVQGLAGATAEIQSLNRELDRLDRRRATATIGVRGGAGSIAQSAAVRQAVGGAGGGGGGGLLSSIPGGGLGLAAVGLGLPAITALTGATTALAGTLVGAGIAGGAGAIAGGGALATGIGSIAAVAIPAKKSIMEAAKEQAKYNNAVKQYGANSTQAVRAKYNMDRAFSKSPVGTRRLIADAHAFGAAWKTATQQAQGNFTSFLADQVHQGRRLVPQLSGAANRDTAALRREGQQLDRGLFTGQGVQASLGGRQGPVGQMFIGQSSAMFDENLTQMRRTAQFTVQTLMQIGVAARPFLLEATTFMGNWTKGWAQSTSNIDHTRSRLKPFVEDFKSVVRFGGATLRLLRDLTLSGHTQGRGMLDQVTGQLNTWDRWIKSNPERMRAFFERTVRQTVDMAKGIWQIAKALGQAAHDLGPLLAGFTQLVQLAGSLGMLQPGALALGAGAFLGAKGRAGDVRRGFLGNVPLILGGGGGRGAAGGGGGALGAGGAAAIGGSYLAARTGTSRLFMEPRPGASLPPGGLATPEAFAAQYGGVEGAHYAGPMSQIGTKPRMLSRFAGLGSLGAGAIAGAGRAYLPIAGILGLLGAAGYQGPGGFGARIQAGASAAIPFVPPPPTQQQISGAASKDVSRLVRSYGGQGTIGQPRNPAELLSQQRAITRDLKERADLVRKSGSDPGDQWKETNKQLVAMQHNLQLVKRQMDAVANDKAIQKADIFAGQFQEGFQNRSKREGPVKAMRDTNRLVLDEMRTLNRAGKRELAQQTISWAQEASRGNPKMVAVYKELQRQVVAQFAAMHQSIRIVDGQILDGTQKQWNTIADQISSAARRGVDHTSAEFKRLHDIALGELMQMGFSRSEAQSVFKLQGGNARQQAAAGTATQLIHGTRGQQQAARNIPGALQMPNPATRALGGRISGSGLRDTVPITPFDLAAPGELILNRHTERDVSHDLMAAGRPTLDQRVRHETRKHSAPGPPAQTADMRPMGGIMPGLALGGRLGLGPAAGIFQGGSGRLSVGGGAGSLPAMIAAANRIDQRHFPYLWGGGHNAAFSGPYDCSGAVSAVLHSGGALGAPLTSTGLMNFGQPGAGEVTIYANPGHTYMSIGGQFFGTSHANPGGGAGWFPGAPRAGFTVRHVNVTGSGAGIGAVGAGGAGGGAPQQIGALHARRSGLGGIPGALSDRATSLGAAALTQHINARLGAMGPGGGGSVGGLPAHGALSRQQVMQLWVAAGGPPGLAAQMASIASAESGFNPAAHNASGASGLWQILGQLVPGNVFDPMVNARNAVAKYRSQGLGAWAASRGVWGGRHELGGRVAPFGGWFGSGGVGTVSSPTTIGVGDRLGGERVSIRPLRPHRQGAGGRVAGGHQITVQVHMGGVQVHGEHDIRRIGDKVGEHVVGKIMDALDDRVPDGELG